MMEGSFSSTSGIEQGWEEDIYVESVGKTSREWKSDAGKGRQPGKVSYSSSFTVGAWSLTQSSDSGI